MPSRRNPGAPIGAPSTGARRWPPHDRRRPRDYGRSAPDRRFIDSGLHPPSIRPEGIDTIAVIVDTSGSLPANTLAPFRAEGREVAADLQPGTVALLQVDAAVQDAAIHSHGDLPEWIAVKGRGGTGFRPGFARLSGQGPRPNCCLYLTDMACGRYPETEPGYPVIRCNGGPPPGRAPHRANATANPGANASTWRGRKTARISR